MSNHYEYSLEGGEEIRERGTEEILLGARLEVALPIYSFGITLGVAQSHTEGYKLYRTLFTVQG